MSLKILVVGQLPPPFHGSNVMADIFLSSLKRLGNQITMVDKSFSAKIDEVGKLSAKKLTVVPSLVFKIIYNLLNKKHNLCFYFVSMKPPSIYVDLILLFLIKLSGLDVVLYVHGKGFQKIGLRLNPVVRLLRDKILSKSLGAIVLGKLLKEDISMIIPNERLFVLPNCVVDTAIHKKEFVNESNKNKSVQILYLSNLVPSKGGMEFLKMAKILLSHSNNVQFVLAGPAPYQSFLKKLKHFIKEEQLSKFVDMPGPVYGTEKDVLFHSSDIFVFPTFFELETFGLVNLEAMRAGLPIVSTNEGSIPEVIIDGINGFIVESQNVDQLTDRVLTLLNYPELRISMGQAGRKIYEQHFTPEVYDKGLQDSIDFFLHLKGCK